MKSRFWIFLWAIVLIGQAFGLSACAGLVRSTNTETNPNARHPTAVIEPHPTALGSTVVEQGYPAPQPVTEFELMTAYPLMKMTDAAQVKTMTAMPTLTSPPPTSTLTPIPTNGPLSDPLPAPLYFMFAPSLQHPLPMQIWRLEPDGFTLTQITDEQNGVDVFYDVSADGRLAFVSHNRLIVTDADGGNRIVLVEGKAPPPIPDQDDWYFDKEEIRSPSWSPDGTQIAFFRDGVNIIHLPTGEIIKIAEGQAYGLDAYGNLRPENYRAPHPLPMVVPRRQSNCSTI